ncbi:hypothetical protein [Enterococcus haemoperoxidus]|uniref:hypothetical protein n=1 Tax=Enterococcus haemoperoxidus TaxID=155618 RepID=UPI001B8081B8|nr:hypothetical protein [Enterococcus haemoperoxidus]
MTSIPYRGVLFYCKSQRLLAELMMHNTWRAKREKFHSSKTQRLLAELMLRNTWRAKREKFHSSKTQRLLAELMMHNTWRTKREKFHSCPLTKKNEEKHVLNSEGKYEK